MNFSYRARMRSAQAAAAFAFSAFGVLMFATPAFAGIGIGVSPNFPGTVVAGQVGVPSSMDITNASSGGVGTVNLDSIFLTPSCGNATTPCASPDLGVFSISSTATGTDACLGQTFSVSMVDPSTGKVQFATSSPLTLALGAKCTLNFTIDVLKVPTVDAAGATGIQTLQIGEVYADFQSLPGSGIGTDITTVNPATPTITTSLSATTTSIGAPVHDSAMLASSTSNAGGSVTYSVYAGNSCIGAPVFTNTKTVLNASVPNSDNFTPLAAGTYNWQAVYSGDANNLGATSTCGSEVLTVLQPQGHIIVDKITNPANSQQSFNFSTTGTGYSGFSLMSGQSNNQTLDAGTYSVSEASTTGWDLTSSTCSINGGTGGSYTPGSPLNLTAGGTIHCVFTNTERGLISGMKFNDLNGNGILDSGEPGL